jgi:TonB family protein
MDRCDVQRKLTNLLVCALLVVHPTVAQTKTSGTKQQAVINGPLGLQRLSNYMRESGLLYIETLENIEDIDFRDDVAFDAAQARFKTIKMMDDRMEIHATSTADKQFLNALETLAHYEHMQFTLHKLGLELARTLDPANKRRQDEVLEQFGLYNSKYIHCASGLRKVIKTSQYAGKQDLENLCPAPAEEETAFSADSLENALKVDATLEMKANPNMEQPVPAPVLTSEKPKPVLTQPIRVNGNEQEAKLIRRVEPTYPALARQARIQGVVRFNAVIARDGTVQNVTVVSGHPMLVQAALETVKQWLYKPTVVNGEPVDIMTTIDVAFMLSK